MYVRNILDCRYVSDTVYVHVDWVMNYIHADILGYLRIPYKYEQARVVFMKMF